MTYSDQSCYVQLLKLLVINTFLLCYHFLAFQVVPRNTCVPCGGSAVLNCTTITRLSNSYYELGGQLWSIQYPDGTNTSLISNNQSTVPAGYEFISSSCAYCYTGLHLLDTNSAWNGTTFQCIAFDLYNESMQNPSAAEVTLEVGSECTICV